MSSRRAIFDRCAVLFSVAIVWAFAALLTLSGAYNGRSINTQISCRTDRSGLIGGAEWWSHTELIESFCIFCFTSMEVKSLHVFLASYNVRIQLPWELLSSLPDTVNYSQEYGHHLKFCAPSWFMVCRIRVPYPFQWGGPSFDAGDAFAMMAASLVALIEVRFGIITSRSVKNAYSKWWFQIYISWKSSQGPRMQQTVLSWTLGRLSSFAVVNFLRTILLAVNRHLYCCI